MRIGDVCSRRGRGVPTVVLALPLLRACLHTLPEGDIDDEKTYTPAPLHDARYVPGQGYTQYIILGPDWFVALVSSSRRCCCRWHT